MKAVLSRRNFIKSSAAFMLASKLPPPLYVNTVNGSMPASAMGTTLIHEHFLVVYWC